VVQGIAENLTRKGYGVTVIAGFYPTTSAFTRIVESNDGDIKIIWLPLLPYPRTRMYLRTSMPPNLRALYRLASTILRGGFDAIHLHGFGHPLIDAASTICRISGRKFLITVHGFPSSPQKSSGLLKYAYRLYSILVGRQTLISASTVIAVSSSVRRETLSHEIDSRRVRVIPNGIDLPSGPTSDNGGFHRKYQLEKEDRLLVSVGSLHERKGFQYLIEAIHLAKKEEPHVKLLIIGRDGGFGNSLAELVRELGLGNDVIFTGYLESTAKLAVMREADIIVIPSLIEPFGLVALEAMSLAKPIVASATGGLVDILSDGHTASLVHPGDSKNLAAVLVRLMHNENDRQLLSSNSAKHAVKYSWNNVIDDYTDLYRSVGRKRLFERLSVANDNEAN